MSNDPPRPPSTRPIDPAARTLPGPAFVDVTLRVQGSNGTATRITIAGHSTLITGDGSAHTSQLAGKDLPLTVLPHTGLHVSVTDCSYLPLPSDPTGDGMLSDDIGVPKYLHFPPHRVTTVTFTLKQS